MPAFDLDVKRQAQLRRSTTIASPWPPATHIVSSPIWWSSVSMAFIDMGDQFIALSEGRSQPPDSARHFGLVVDDREAVRKALAETEAEIVPSRGLDFRDPWGNHIQVVEYGDIQFSKTPAVLRGMGMPSLAKTPEAEAELREKGLAD